MRTRRTVIVGGSAIAAVILITAVLGAVQGDREPPGRADHPCRRITTADLETVVPAPVNLVQREIANGGQICRWSYPLPAGQGGPATAIFPTSSIEVGVWQGRQYYVPDAVPEEFTPIPGIADAAHINWPGFVTFRKGETVVVIENRQGFDLSNLLNRRADDDLPRWRALATLIASRY